MSSVEYVSVVFNNRTLSLVCVEQSITLIKSLSCLGFPWGPFGYLSVEYNLFLSLQVSFGGGRLRALSPLLFSDSN